LIEVLATRRDAIADGVISRHRIRRRLPSPPLCAFTFVAAVQLWFCAIASA
jgi:hypothetical protein